jgi:hypothetical protein
MPGFAKAIDDLGKAADALQKARKEENDAIADEKDKNKAYWKGKLKGAARERAFIAWQKADTRRKKATLKRMEAEKKLRQALKRFTQELLKLIFP